MRFLSVAERELRVTARRAWFYRARWLTALVFLGVLLWLAWVFDVARNRRTADLFEAFTIFVFSYCLLVGTASTADCLSRERREGTLGLLFLTNLNSLEIIAGKLASNSLTLLYSLLAIFPLLAVPVLFGGITALDFWCAMLALLNALLFAMAAGFVASAVCVRQFPAVALATGLVLFFGAGWVGIMELLENLGWPAEITDPLKLFCPLKTLLEASHSRIVFARHVYWNSLGCVALTSLIGFLLVAWWTARAWRDRPRRARVRAGKPASSTGPSPARLALRRRLLAINPFFWLASRQRIGAPVFMVLSAGLILLTVWVTAPFFGRVLPAGKFKVVMGHVFAWLWTTAAIHVLTLYYAAAAASQRLAEDRHTGALELVLATSTNERIISRGLWLAYWRRMAYPMLLATLVHFYLIWQGALIFTLDPIEGLPPGTTPGELLRAALSNGYLRGEQVHWAYGFILRVFLLAWVLAGITWITLGAVGRWLGLSLKRPGFAPLVALGLLAIPPVLLFSTCAYLADTMEIDRLPERLFLPLMLALAFGIGGTHCLGLWLWATAHLRENFRTMVISRELPETRRARWRTNGRVMLRLGAGLAGLLLLSAIGGYLYVANQNSQSYRRWTAFRQRHGDGLQLSTALPPPVAASQNFAASPAFQAVLRQKPQDRYALGLAGSAIRNASGFAFAYNANDPTVAWIRQSMLNFAEQLKSAGGQPTAAYPNPAATVLERLAAMQPELDAIAAAAGERPQFMTAATRDRAGVFDTKSQELRVLESLHGYFQLRACARLETGDPAAAAQDTLTGLRLTQLAAQSIDLHAAARAQLLAGRSIQPIWEGLASRAWTEPQLAELQAELGRLNLLITFSNNVRRTVLAHVELWDQFGNTARHLPLTGATYYRSSDRWQPRGWWYDCAIQLYNHGKEIEAKINTEPAWIGEPANPQQVYQLPLDYESQQLLLQAKWWGNNFTLVSYAQTAVNEAIVACALGRYRLAKGAYPDSLAPLVPDLLPRVPTDVLRGRPLIYHQQSGRYSLRGVGPNLRDDYGQTVSDDWLWSFGTNAPALK